MRTKYIQCIVSYHLPINKINPSDVKITCHGISTVVKSSIFGPFEANNLKLKDECTPLYSFTKLQQVLQRVNSAIFTARKNAFAQDQMCSQKRVKGHL